MSLLVPDEGEVVMLDLIFVATDVLCLYKSPTTANAESDTWSTYTESDFTSYANYTLTAWNGASTSGGTSSKTHPAHTFTVGSTQLIVGYIVRSSANKIKTVERVYSSGQTYNSGDSFTVTPKANLD